MKPFVTCNFVNIWFVYIILSVLKHVAGLHELHGGETFNPTSPLPAQRWGGEARRSRQRVVYHPFRRGDGVGKQGAACLFSPSRMVRSNPPEKPHILWKMNDSCKDRWWVFLSFVYQTLTWERFPIWQCFWRYLENRGFEAACWQGWQGSETSGQPEGMSWTIMNSSMHWTSCCNSSTKILAKLNWDGWFLLCTCV